MTRSSPAILEGDPAFPERLSVARPTVEDPDGISRRIRAVIESGHLTDGPLTRKLEEEVAATFGVEHCVAVSSCTIGLMLVIQALEIDGPVVVPSFTFTASANAVAWNGLPLAFADCSPTNWCLRPEDIIGEPKAILAVHVSGVPCDVVGLQATADEIGAPLIFDAAHGAGSLVEISGKSSPLGGFGSAEVFSLTPTKVLNGAEGGLVTTNDPGMAERMRVARNYGNPGDYDTRFPGLNGRLSELHAAIALSSLEHLEERVQRRNELADSYQEQLGGLPGVRFQVVPAGARSCYKDLTILVDEEAFGCSRDALATSLEAEGVETRKYYSPPLHLQQAFATDPPQHLPTTEGLAGQVLTLPMWSHLSLEEVERVCHAIFEIQAHADKVDAAIQGSAG